MRIFLGLLFFGILAGGVARGQVFEPGYLVTAAGDTLWGELENRHWQAPPEGVVFRSTPSVAGRLYRRVQLQAFRLTGGRYFRAEVVPLDRDAQTRVSSLPQKLVINQLPDSLLVEVLVDGKVPLLRAVIAGVTHYFVRRPGRPYLELTERKYLAESAGHQRIVDANNYQSQLTVYFGDCPAAVKIAETAPYSAKGLAGVVQAFRSACTADKQLGTDYTMLAQPSRPFAVNWGLLAGVSQTSLQLNNSGGGIERPLLSGLKLDGHLHPAGGLYLDVLLPGRRWVGHSEAVLSSFGQRSPAPLAGGVGTYTWYGTKIDARIGARWMVFQHMAHEVFLGIGFNFNFTTSYESQEQYGSGDSRLALGFVRLPTQASFLEAINFKPGPYMEVGVRSGRFTLSADAGLGGGVDYIDPLAVNYAGAPPSSSGVEVTGYKGYSYWGTLVAYRALLAFRLGRQPDSPAK